MKNLVALSIGCVAAVILLEAALRIYNPLQATVKGQRIVLPVNKRYVTENRTIRKLDRTIVHTKNSLGFRGAEPPAEFANHLTLVTVGGSTTECKYLSDGETWVDILGRNLDRDFDRVWVNNAGLDGHSTHGHMVLTANYLSKLKPKLALFLVGLNDIGRRDLNAFELQHVRDRVDTTSLRGFIKSVSSYSESFALGLNLYRHYRAATMGLSHREVVLDKLEPAAGRSSAHGDEETGKYAGQYQARLTRLVRVAREHGIDPVLITQPALYGSGIDDVTGVDLARIRLGRLDGKSGWDRLERYNDATRRVGQAEDVLVIDLARELPKSSRYFYDFYHFTSEGAQRVGDIIHRRLAPYLRARYPQYRGAVSSEQ